MEEKIAEWAHVGGHTGVHYTTYSGVYLKFSVIKRYFHSFYVSTYFGEALSAPRCCPRVQLLNTSCAHSATAVLTSLSPAPYTRPGSGIWDGRATRHSSRCPLHVLCSVPTSLSVKKTTAHLGSAQESPPLGSWSYFPTGLPPTEVTTAPCSPHGPGGLGRGREACGSF